MAVTNISGGPIYIGRFRILPGDGLPALPLTAEEEADVERLIGKGLLERSKPKADAPQAGDKPQAGKEAESALKPENKPDKGKDKDKPDKTGDKHHGADD